MAGNRLRCSGKPLRLPFGKEGPGVEGALAPFIFSVPPLGGFFVIRVYSPERGSMKGLFDSYHRHIDYLRISITDRCNLRCFYCSDGSFPHLPRHEVLSYA